MTASTLSSSLACGLVAVIGGGPSGLFVAERVSASGRAVALFDRMPSIGRKFLLAGRSGLNLTHSEDHSLFTQRYGQAAPFMAPLLAQFGPKELRAWAASLGVESFVGSSGRVFPVGLKATPLLRAWRARLYAQGVRFYPRHEWQGWDEEGRLLFQTDQATRLSIAADVTVLALGGGSWPRMGSNGAWTGLLTQRDIAVSPLQPTNCGFEIPWSDFFGQKWAGHPLKSIAASCGGYTIRAEAMLTGYGMEGTAIYALSQPLRCQLQAQGCAQLVLDLKPDLSLELLIRRLAGQPKALSLSKRLHRAARLAPAAIALLREAGALPSDVALLAGRIKKLPLRVTAARPLGEAISTAGGLCLPQLNEGLMVRAHPGLFACGEMLDWEAPTGGYLLQGCFSTAACAAQGVIAWLAARQDYENNRSLWQ